MNDQQADDRPDRNLALELVRVTEAAALASARMVGRGDKEGADQAAVDAMRNVLDSVSMDGVVVIGEGEKDEAPMLFNGERIGDGTPARGRCRGRPAGGHAADRAGDAERDRGDRAGRARHDVRPRPVRVHGEDRRRSGDRRPARPRPAAARDARAGGRAQGDRHPRRDGGDARPRAPPRGDGPGPRGRRPGAADPRRRRVGGAARGQRELAGRPAVGDRRDARGRDLGGGDQVHRRPAARAPVAARRR